MKTHTPIPWTAVRGETGELILRHFGDKGTSDILVVMRSHPSRVEGDVELIVKAVNHYEEMLSALETISDTTHHIMLDGKGSHSPTCPPCLASAILISVAME